MKYRIRVSPEIIIKSKPVRKKAIKLLFRNIKSFLSNYEGGYELTFFWDKIELVLFENIDEKKEKEILDIILKIPGIYSISKIIEKDFCSLEDIFNSIKDNYSDIKNKKEVKSFCVRVNRKGLHKFNSVEAERILGGMFKNFLEIQVNLSKPDLKIELDIVDDKFMFFLEKKYGVGGYPVGFQGKVLSLISGGFDSSVSSFLLMKRGCKLDYLFFDLGAEAHLLGVKQISYYLWGNFSKNYNANFLVVDFKDIVKELLLKIDHKYRAIILKRLMLYCASQLGQKHYLALVKGDSIGQVSSQTLENLSIIDKSSSILTFRPLTSFDKQEIIDLSKKIGTYNFSCSMPEYCGVVSDKPATKSKEEIILEQENLLDKKIIENCIKNYKIEKVKNMLFSDYNKNLDISEIKQIKENDIIIDLRENDLFLSKPLKLEKAEIINIPFFDINSKFKNLDQNKNYLLYCDKGVLSKLHALYLKEKGFKNVKIFKI